MADRGQITGGILDGFLAFDDAVSTDAAKIKGIVSPVAGRADIFVVPDLEAGNMLAKQLEYLAGAQLAGIVLGVRVPIVLTSRADRTPASLASCAIFCTRPSKSYSPSARQFQPLPSLEGVIRISVKCRRNSAFANGAPSFRDEHLA
jgi:phosphotransacetylase